MRVERARRDCRAIVALSALLPACTAPDAADTGTIVVGITSNLEVGPDIARLAVESSIDGAPVVRSDRSVGGAEPLAFPLELPFEHLSDGSRIDVRMMAFDGSPGEPAFLTRHVATSVIAGQSLLLRVHLGWECVPSFHLGGSLIAPSCQEPDTCVAAECTDAYVPPSKLEPYAPTWAAAFADQCRPLDAGPPELAIGQGAEAFTALSPGEEVRMNAGPQGGYHVWLAVRMKNLHRVGSITTLTASRTATGEELCMNKLPLDFVPAGNGECDLAGIRCVVSYDIHGAQMLDGEKIHISAKVVDITGDAGFAEQDLTLTAAQ